MIRFLMRIGDTRARRMLAAYLVVVTVATLLTSAAFVTLLPLTTALLSDEPASMLAPLGLLVAFAVLAGMCDVTATLIGQRAGARFILRMHQLIAERTARLPLGWFDAERTGSISNVTTRGVTFAANAPESMIRPMLYGLVPPTLVSLAMLRVEWRLGLCFLLAAGLVAVVYRWAQARDGRFEQAVDASDEEGAARVIEFAAAQPAVRAAGPDSLGERSVRTALAEQRTAKRAALIARNWGTQAYTAAGFAGLLLIFVVAVALTGAGRLQPGALVAVLILAVAMSTLTRNALPFGVGVGIANRALDALRSILDAPLLPEPEHPRTPADSSIELADVSFSYSPDRPVISGANFRMEPGTMTAIVGPSGSGKTTLARLMARFWDVDSGEIRIGGVDVRELGTRNVMAQVSMVFQDVYLFEDTLMENIRLGRPGATDDEVGEAAERAGVTEIADRLPDGFATQVGESGGTLSGGERQRVSIARALLKNAPIVLLDEATAALDIESEMLIQRGLAQLSGDKTLVVIAHRLQTIRQADQVVVLDGNGGVEAVGDHETLLTASPTYARFWAERTESMGWTIDAH
ncbi:ABC transporter ATP-binding protein [Actinopolymorpha pittospori]|uniref:ATP-binding cassette subfamily B protein n=1 Tax=Actinopolymorpha pittospori TaxID=648752 RepID=A0A927MMT2_9ACTN|nr:ABC transporter ATP-binding protein [Actinopolymorpha pittospori]MBE1603414.1 ATP-binding cassette subfamily B protein [Actinopolymorpha pittospori]